MIREGEEKLTVIKEEYIIGGRPYDIEEAPFQASLRHTGKHICGAVIISERHALTAAHCYDAYSDLTVYSFVVGSSNANDNSDAFKTTLKDFIQHDDYFIITNVNDIALLVLEEKLPINMKTIAPIRLPSPNAPLPVGKLANVTGW